MDDLLKHFCEVAHLFNAISVDDCCIGVADTEQFLVYYPGETIDYGFRAGAPIKPGGLTHRALTTGQRQVDFIPREVYGIPAMGVGFPIIKDGKVIGCVSTGMTREKQDQLQMAAEKLSAAMEQMSATAQQLSAASTEVATLMTHVQTQASELKQGLTQIHEVNRVIKGVADQTKLIALNAKIEAARIGEQGRAFAVVASAISDLAETTETSLASIGQVVEAVNHSVEAVAASVESASAISKEQLLGIEELTQMSTGLTGEAETLNQLAQLGH